MTVLVPHVWPRKWQTDPSHPSQLTKMMSTSACRSLLHLDEAGYRKPTRRLIISFICSAWSFACRSPCRACGGNTRNGCFRKDRNLDKDRLRRNVPPGVSDVRAGTHMWSSTHGQRSFQWSTETTVRGFLMWSHATVSTMVGNSQIPQPGSTTRSKSVRAQRSGCIRSRHPS